MDEEQAINSIGKDVYLVDYKAKTINKEKVISVEEVSPIKPYQYRVITESGQKINPLFTYDKAYRSLVRFYEQSVDIAMSDLNDVLEMAVEPYDS